MTDRKSECTIDALPNEILELILNFLPLKDLQQCIKVSHRWKSITESVFTRIANRLVKSLVSFDIEWTTDRHDIELRNVRKRYGHSACCDENFMYIFGGGLGNMSATCNDLWRFDLLTHEWTRLGTEDDITPSEKTCASMLHYNDSLILFGGWSRSPGWYTLSELHRYDIRNNKWEAISANSPPSLAGHSATIHQDNMIVFGGLCGQHRTSGDVWSFNLETHIWEKKYMQGPKPKRRFGQTQVFLDAEHLLILGGHGEGDNEVFDDVWMLEMSGESWHWDRVAVNNPEWSPSHLWCHPACRVGNYVVAFSRNTVNREFQTKTNFSSSVPERRPAQSSDSDASESDSDSSSSSNYGVLHCHMENGVLVQDQADEESEDDIRAQHAHINDMLYNGAPEMAMFVLDISSVLTDCFVSWLPIKEIVEGGPGDKIMYSLVLGIGELIMFGGLRQDVSVVNNEIPFISRSVSNGLDFISPPLQYHQYRINLNY